MWSGFVCKNAISGLLPIREPKHNDGLANRRLPFGVVRITQA
jgi:hypothetical protein